MRRTEKGSGKAPSLNPADQPDRVINTVTGRLGPEKVNVPNAVEIHRCVPMKKAGHKDSMLRCLKRS